MRRMTGMLATAGVLGILTLAAAGARADDGPPLPLNSYLVTPLVSDLQGAAANHDGVLQNAWGIAFSPAGSPFWIADNATGCSTLYDGTGVKQALQVQIPLPGGVLPSSSCVNVDPNHPPGTTPAAPTGVVWNATTNPATAFLVPGTATPAVFIFATENGTISAWGGGASATIAVDNANANTGPVYKGLVFGTNPKGVFLFATNFRDGTIDVFDHTYAKQTLPAGRFADQNIPPGYAPFGIQNIDGDLFVTYAKQDQAKHDDVAGPGNGFVDVYDTGGTLLRRFATRGTLNSPWGVARASFHFGRFSGAVLIGNFGDGRINAFDSRGQFLGQLAGPAGRPLTIDGLWSLTLGGGRNSSSDTLYFTAGPNDESDGLFGTITPTPASGRSLSMDR